MTTPFRPRKGTKASRLARERLRALLFHHAHEADDYLALVRKTVPDAWLTLEADIDTEEAKEKVTLYLDRSVARFYRAMGKGYQARINRLLATWAQLRIAEHHALDRSIRDWLKDALPPDTAESREALIARVRRQMAEDRRRKKKD